MAENMKIQPVEQCGAVGKCQSHPSGYEHACTSAYFSRKPTKERIATYALQQLEAARAKDVEAHEKNLPIMAANKAIAERVTALMNEIGMPIKWSERDRNSRSRYPKTISHSAGYITDLSRECRTDDGFASATSTYEELKRRYTEFAAEGKRDAEAAERARAIEQQEALNKRKADMELATLLLRYQLPIEATWGDVLDHLCGKHQRLILAVAMQLTRGDWSEGPYRVKDALHSFTIETNEDKDIVADVAQHLVDFEDRRCFRDTTWSYDALFASVAATDPQLVADVKLALQHTRD